MYEVTGYDVFGSKTDSLQDQAVVNRTEASFKKTMMKRAGQLPDGSVSIALTKQDSSDKPIYVFIRKTRKTELLPPALAARVSVAEGTVNALEAMWSKDDTVTMELYYKHKFEALKENSLHLFDRYMATPKCQQATTWEEKYNAIIQAAVPDFMSGKPPELRKVRDIALAAVKQDGMALEHASDALKNDKDVVMAAVTQDWRALEHASNALRNDKDVVMAALKQNGWALKFASDTLRNDKDVVMAAVKQSGLTLEYASNALKNDKDVVMAAVKQNGGALEYASDPLKNDREVVLAAIRRTKLAFRHASPTLQQDPEIRAAADCA